MGAPTATAAAPAAAPAAPAAPAAEFKPGWPSKATPSKHALWLMMGLAAFLLVYDIVILIQASTGNWYYGFEGKQAWHILYRWIHLIAGITWIGLLYFFNFVNIPFAKEADFATIKGVYIPKLLARGLFWFRWMAMNTVLAGWGLIFLLYGAGGTYGFNSISSLWETPNGQTILTGMILGMVMWFNVWFIIWPNQKKAIFAVESKQAPDPKWGKTALMASRTNTVLSFPMLFFMAASAHYPLPIWGILAVVGIGSAFAALFVWVGMKS
ncbi:MAG TPA: urate hydroxylase PuuD [Thermoplasmata archaeon]|nr:urate hydroxylase PuuD [Thermoplasmata archaeon]